MVFSPLTKKAGPSVPGETRCSINLAYHVHGFRGFPLYVKKRVKKKKKKLVK
jgi:hypothetical protein